MGRLESSLFPFHAGGRWIDVLFIVDVLVCLVPAERFNVSAW